MASCPGTFKNSTGKLEPAQRKKAGERSLPCEEQLKELQMFALESGQCSERNNSYPQIFDMLWLGRKKENSPKDFLFSQS